MPSITSGASPVTAKMGADLVDLTCWRLLTSKAAINWANNVNLKSVKIDA